MGREGGVDCRGKEERMNGGKRRKGWGDGKGWEWTEEGRRNGGEGREEGGMDKNGEGGGGLKKKEGKGEWKERVGWTEEGRGCGA